MSFPRYPKYKDSGANWLGEVPGHWNISPLKYVATFRSGGTPSKEKPEYWEGDVPWASSKDLKSETLSDTQDHISHTVILDGIAEFVPIGSVLVVVRGMILLHTFPVTQITRPMTINQDLKALTPKTGISCDFLAWLLRGSVSETFARIEEAAHGTKVLRMDLWTAMLLPVPPSEEQTIIATFLDRETAKIDGLVAEQRRLRELLKEKRQAVNTHAVTKGMNSSAAVKPSGITWIGDVPAHWTIERLTSVCQFQSGKAHEPFIDDTGQFICANSRFVSTGGRTKKFCTDNLSPAQQYDILMVMSDLPNGRALARAFFVEDDVAYAVNQRVCIVRTRVGNPRYYFYQLNRNEAFMRHDDGVSQTHLSNATFEKFKILVPPHEEQARIAAFLDLENSRFDVLTAEADRAIGLLQERRTALISAAVTGKIDVRDLVSPWER